MRSAEGQHLLFNNFEIIMFYCLKYSDPLSLSNSRIVRILNGETCNIVHCNISFMVIKWYREDDTRASYYYDNFSVTLLVTPILYTRVCLPLYSDYDHKRRRVAEPGKLHLPKNIPRLTMLTCKSHDGQRSRGWISATETFLVISPSTMVRFSKLDEFLRTCSGRPWVSEDYNSANMTDILNRFWFYRENRVIFN